MYAIPDEMVLVPGKASFLLRYFSLIFPFDWTVHIVYYFFQKESLECLFLTAASYPRKDFFTLLPSSIVFSNCSILFNFTFPYNSMHHFLTVSLLSQQLVPFGDTFSILAQF